jgi:hypothetical protein
MDQPAAAVEHQKCWHHNCLAPGTMVGDENERAGPVREIFETVDSADIASDNERDGPQKKPVAKPVVGQRPTKNLVPRRRMPSERSAPDSVHPSASRIDIRTHATFSRALCNSM